jgi:hypothetical protein
LRTRYSNSDAYINDGNPSHENDQQHYTSFRGQPPETMSHTTARQIPPSLEASRIEHFQGLFPEIVPGEGHPSMERLVELDETVVRSSHPILPALVGHLPATRHGRRPHARVHTSTAEHEYEGCFIPCVRIYPEKSIAEIITLQFFMLTL